MGLKFFYSNRSLMLISCQLAVASISAGCGIHANRTIGLSIISNQTVLASPTSLVADGAASSTVTVTLVDWSGNPRVGKTVSLSSSRGGLDTVSAASGPSSSQGVVTFTVTSTTAGTALLTATDVTDSAPVAQTATLTFNPGPVAQLVMLPVTVSNTTSMSPLASMTVQEQDANGNVVTSASDTIVISISADPTAGAAQLFGTNPQTAVNGAATFSNLAIDVTGNGYTLTAYSGSLTSSATNSFNINAGAASKLAFLEQPNGGTATIALSPSITVGIVDAGGNLVTAANDTITMSLTPNPGYLGGTLSAATSSGIATFSNLTISTAGTYQLTATSSSTYGSTASNSFSIVATTPVNLQVPIEMLDTAITSMTSTHLIAASKTYLDPGWYDGTVTYTFEVVATSTLGTPQTVSLIDPAATPYATVTVPASQANPLRISATFSTAPASGPTIYRLYLPTSLGLNIYAARIIVTQSNATRTRIWVPLLSGSTSSTALTLDSTTSSAWGQPTPAYYLDWLYDLTHFTASTVSFTLEAAMKGNTCAALVDEQTGNIVTGGSPIQICSTSQFYGVGQSPSFDTSASNFTAGHKYQIQINTPGGTGNISRGGLWISLNGIVKAQSIYRVLRKLATNSSQAAFHQKATLDASLFTASSVSYQCMAFQSIAGTQSINLLDGGASGGAGDGAITGSMVTNSTLNITSATPAWYSTGTLSITNGNVDFSDVIVSSGKITVQACEALMNTN